MGHFLAILLTCDPLNKYNKLLHQIDGAMIFLIFAIASNKQSEDYK
jgi:hypothetical protein